MSTHALPSDVLRLILELAVVAPRDTKQPYTSLFRISQICYIWLRPIAYGTVRITSAPALDAFCYAMTALRAREPQNTFFADAVRHLGVYIYTIRERSRVLGTRTEPPISAEALLISQARNLLTLAAECTSLTSFATNMSVRAAIHTERFFGAGTASVAVTHSQRLTHLDLGHDREMGWPFVPYYFRYDRDGLPVARPIVDLTKPEVIASLPALTHLAVHRSRCTTEFLPTVLRNRTLRVVLVYGIRMTRRNHPLAHWSMIRDPQLLLASAGGDTRVRFLTAEEHPASAFDCVHSDLWEAHLALGDDAFAIGGPDLA
ncbi:hypothetical protein EXIGLDRAFT_735663 [Exidia glandulosa HHB12029]|uniref:Uncharacterized protein n=1 Tax=Exidia glandulosa HHB12029 TaxID=1314781 RepID=A0A165PHB1_EXIGL|nr:hypothetical protein EXIGLDRAFT_735663 [Exidia glandulosa HHB12029]